MYHHHQQPSYNPYAAPNPPQYAPQYGTWPEQPHQGVPVSPNTFSGSFHRQPSTPQYPQYPQYQQQYQQYPPQNPQYNPQPHRPTPASYQKRRTSVQQRWDDYLSSEECPENLQGADQAYVNQVTSELEQRATADERIESLSQQSGVDTQHAQQAERDRRLKWAQEMIIQNPALCAEVYFAMSKRPAAGNPGSQSAPKASSRSNSNSSVNSANSSYSGSPT
ncbi:hypothetical protein GTA08_BOTSDO09933 [Neofusicoccum parvum]|uniref:Uncharacterized protein n=1 Tax=Neofusicoccum parvum TaxID=310453 RepID=A0ACB5RWA5_9PEZI|nr:hypothetical protein GTA08_BOTSDO09933 [Neofusicoccum parvum]